VAAERQKSRAAANSSLPASNPICGGGPALPLPGLLSTLRNLMLPPKRRKKTEVPTLRQILVTVLDGFGERVSKFLLARVFLANKVL
jgi:hypothetical protein